MAKAKGKVKGGEAKPAKTGREKARRYATCNAWLCSETALDLLGGYAYIMHEYGFTNEEIGRVIPLLGMTTWQFIK